jgi:hypothetical protein
VLRPELEEAKPRRSMVRSCLFVPRPELKEAEADGEELRALPPIRDGEDRGGRGVRGRRRHKGIQGVQRTRAEVKDPGCELAGGRAR